MESALGLRNPASFFRLQISPFMQRERERERESEREQKQEFSDDSPMLTQHAKATEPRDGGFEGSTLPKPCPLGSSVVPCQGMQT